MTLQTTTPGSARDRGEPRRANAPNAVAQIKPLLTAEAPEGGWRRVFADSLLVGGATVFGQVLGAVTSLLLRLLLSPTQVGIWQGLKLALSYGNYSGLGISKAAARDVSLASGKHGTSARKAAELARGINLAFTINTLTSLLYATVLVGVAAWIGWRGGEMSTAWAGGLLFIAALAMLQRYVTFRVTLLRADQQFRSTALLSVQEAILTLGMTAICVWLWGLSGLYAATALVMVASLWFLERRKGNRFRFTWHSEELRRLMRIGGPLLAAGIVSSLFRSLDKIVLLTTATDGEFQLGCYSTALLVAVQLYGLANILGGVCGPRLTQAFGKSEDPRSVARMAARLTEMTTIALALPAALAVAIAPSLLLYVLPEYAAGLPALTPMVWGTLALGLALPAQHCLVAWNRGRAALSALIAGTLLAIVLDGIAVLCGGGLERIALATMCANFAYLILMFWLTMRSVPRVELQRRTIAIAASLLPLMLATAFTLFGSVDEPSQAAIVGGLSLATWAIVLVIGWRQFGWRDFVIRDAN